MADHDDDTEHLIERPLSSQQVYKGNFLDVRKDIVQLPDGSSASREYIVHPGAVGVVPLLDDGRVVMVRQHRHPIGQLTLELPAGKIDPGEPTERTALRELREETGYVATEIAFACRIHNAAAYSSEAIEIFFARGLTLGEQALDAGEFIDIHRLTDAELDELARTGAMTDVKTLIGLMWLQKWRAGAWPLDWQPVPR